MSIFDRKAFFLLFYTPCTKFYLCILNVCVNIIFRGEHVNSTLRMELDDLNAHIDHITYDKVKLIFCIEKESNTREDHLSAG